MSSLNFNVCLWRRSVGPVPTRLRVFTLDAARAGARGGGALMKHSAPDTITLKHTPLHALHLELGARMAPFAGYEMPIRFALGVLKEHLHTRSPPVCSTCRIGTDRIALAFRPNRRRCARSCAPSSSRCSGPSAGSTTLRVFHQRPWRHHRRPYDRPLRPIIWHSSSTPAAKISMNSIFVTVCRMFVRSTYCKTTPCLRCRARRGRGSGATLAVVRIDALHGYSAGLDCRRELPCQPIRLYR